MTREERRAYIQSIVDAAPALAPEDADLLRALMPVGGHLAARRRASEQGQRRASRQSAA